MYLKCKLRELHIYLIRMTEGSSHMAYSAEFAGVYDILMEHIPYDEWADYICQLLEKAGIKSGLLLELGCGTGAMTRRLAGKGYDMIGIDNSADMLSEARELGLISKEDILYLCQDMRSFELYGTVAAAFCVCNTINYLLEEEELLEVFKLVNRYLDPGGLFIFDMDTVHAYENIMGDNTIAINREEGSFIWENTFYPEKCINEVRLTLFLPRLNPDGERVYIKREETHVRRAYSIDDIRRLIDEAGMEWVAAYGEMSEEEPDPLSERVYIVAREKYQQGKLYL